MRETVRFEIAGLSMRLQRRVLLELLGKMLGALGGGGRWDWVIVIVAICSGIEVVGIAQYVTQSLVELAGG